MSTENIFKYGDLEAYLDCTDYLVIEKWEKGFAGFQKKAEKAHLLTGSASIKALVDNIADLFDCVCGEGASLKALSNTTSLTEATNALIALTDYFKEQNQATIQRNQEALQAANQYSPKNREQRRSAK